MRKKSQINRVCYACDSNISVENNGINHWYNNKPTSLYLCKKCFNRIISNPIHNPINRKKTICFKKHDIVLKENPRKGICKLCNIIGKRTVIHHVQYHKEDVLKDTIELCVSCHIKEHWKLGTYN